MFLFVNLYRINLFLLNQWSMEPVAEFRLTPGLVEMFSVFSQSISSHSILKGKSHWGKPPQMRALLE